MRRRLVFLVRLALSGVLIALILRWIDWKAVAPILATIDARLAVLASTLTLGLILLLAVRWSMLLRAAACPLPFRTVFRLAWAGQFFNSFLPGSIGGDGLRAIEIIRRFPQRRLAGAGSIVLDRGSALVALVAISAVSLMIDPAPLRWIESAKVSGRFLTLGAVGLLALCGGAIWWWRRSRANSLGPFQALRSFPLPSPAVFGRALALSACIHLLNFTIILVFARAIGLPLTFGEVVRMMSVVLLFLLLPITINGHGLRELLLIKYLAYYGVGNAESAVAWSLLLVANDLAWGLPGGVWYLLSRKGETSEAGGGDERTEAV